MHVPNVIESSKFFKYQALETHESFCYKHPIKKKQEREKEQTNPNHHRKKRKVTRRNLETESRRNSQINL